MTPERFEDVEKRTRLVEEAIIEFKYIAKTVVVEHAERITHVEKDIDDIKASIYLTCDAKTREIDDKIGTAIDKAAENTEKLFKQSVGISAAMFMLFIAGMGYVVSDVKILQTGDATNSANINYIQHSLDKILDSVADLHKDLGAKQ